MWSVIVSFATFPSVDLMTCCYYDILICRYQISCVINPSIFILWISIEHCHIHWVSIVSMTWYVNFSSFMYTDLDTIENNYYTKCIAHLVI